MISVRLSSGGSILLLLLCIVAAAPMVTPTSAASSTVGQLPCTYMITAGATAYTALNCANGSTLYSSRSAAPVINDAIGNATSGGKILIKAGNYLLSSLVAIGGGEYAAIGSATVNNIELFGEGNATILTANTNLNGMVIGTENLNGWYIHDLQINGNRASQSATGNTAPYLDGIFAYGGTGTTIERVYVHDCKTFGIDAAGTDLRILNNYVVNSNANGIQVDWASQDVVVAGNVVKGASDVGISINGNGGTVTDANVYGNVVLQINLDKSPFAGGNNGIGIDVGDNGAVRRANIFGNILETGAGGAAVGILSYPGSGTNFDITISDNTIYNYPTGINVYLTNGITINDNTINGASALGAQFQTTALNVKFSGNTVENETGSTGGLYSQSNGAFISGNTFNETQHGVLLYGASYSTISTNTFIWADMAGPSASVIQLQGASDYNQISGNTVDAYHSTAISVQLAGSASYNIISHNVIPTANSVYIGSYANVGNRFDGNIMDGTRSMSDSGASTVVTNNQGLDPIGVVSSPFGGTLSLPFYGTNVGNFGTSGTATPTSGVTYTAVVPVDVTITSGTGQTITTKDASRNIIDNSAPSLSHRLLLWGYTITVTFSTLGTTTVVEATVGVGGSTSVPTAGVNYVDVDYQLTVTSTGGTGISYTIQDGTTNRGGTTIASSLSTLTAFPLQPGQIITLTSSSGAPTVVVVAY